MKASPHIQLHLTEGDETTKAVTQTSGSGVNLWVGGICITADNALMFHELAKVAQLAAQLQESVDEKRTQPHAFSMSPHIEKALRDAGVHPRTDTCDLCRRRRDEHEVKS